MTGPVFRGRGTVDSESSDRESDETRGTVLGVELGVESQGRQRSEGLRCKSEDPGLCPVSRLTGTPVVPG